MKRVGGVGCGHDPFVVGLVEGFIDTGVVEAAVYPVDAKVGKADEEGKLEVVIESEGRVRGCVVEFSVSTDFKEKERSGTDGHNRH